MGEGDGQIAPVVLERARALYLRTQGASEIPATSPWTRRARTTSAQRPAADFTSSAKPTARFARFPRVMAAVAICRASRISQTAGRCAKNFGNAMDSDLTAGGAYVTGETNPSFKGYYRVAARPGRHLPPPLRAVRRRRRDRQRQAARHRRTSGRAVEGRLPAQRVRQPLRRTVTVMFRSAIWSITPAAAATAAPVGRPRTPSKSFRC